MNPSTKFFVGVIVLVGLAVGGYYVYFWTTKTFYTVTDQFVDTTGIETVSVAFVQVEEYDSLKVNKVARILTQEAHEEGKVDLMKPRTFLYHFFKAGDTASLTDAMIDELAYTHPAIVDPEKQLMAVPNGWVVRVSFGEKMVEPRSEVTQQTLFFMPRPGVRAKDLR